MDWSSILTPPALLLTGYILYGAIYRLYLSPVASFPGPRLAALTFWYEFWYDVVKGGKYTWKIAELHDQYGPIIRINPFEIHINDPDFYDEVYVNASRRKTEIWSWTVPMFGTPNSILATKDHDIHRRRRSAYSNYFSKQIIKKYSNVIQSSVDKLCTRFNEHATKNQPINLVYAFSAMAGDVVTGYCFPESYKLLDTPDFSPQYSELWKSILANGHALKQFPWLFPTMLKLPGWFVERYLPDLAVTYQWQRKWESQIMDIKTGSEIEANDEEASQSSIFRTLLDSDLPPQDKTVRRLVEDAQTMVGAGSETSARTLAVGTYHILSNPHILQSLMSELETAIPDPNTPPQLSELEKLPYLTATIYETLRIASGVTHRLQRLSPETPIQYKSYTIPAGTPVSMTSTLIHSNPSIFPDPYKFDPERWLPLHTKGRRLQKYLVAFSRGSRQCLGMNLAWAEMYIALATIFRKYGGSMKIVATARERDVDVSHDLFTGFARRESKGIMMVVIEKD